MGTSLLATKLYIPPTRAGLVARPRLLERLRACLNYSLVLISASAGFGKTTLLSEWVHYGRPPAAVAWFSIEESENDPIRFWEYLIATLRTAKPDIGETASNLLRSPQPLPIQSVLTPLINEIAGIPKDFFLVLDDYHFIQSPEVHNGITFLLEHLPPRMHLVIATRTDPPLPLVHFRGKGTLLEIGADDLRFTLEEAFSLLKELKVPAISAEAVRALNDKAEGWVVGLKMAMLSLKGEKDIASFISGFTGTQRYIMDYLLEEVLQRQPPEVCDFLLKTSVLERLIGPLCDAITGRSDGRETLISLEKANLFIVPLDESRQWYRYEHLFAELLRHRLETAFGADKISELHRLSSGWHEGNGFLEKAIDHALAARDWEKAMRLTSLTDVRSVTLVGWLRQVPVDVLLTDVALYFRYVESMFAIGQHGEVDRLLDFAEKTALEKTRAWVAVMRTTLAMVRHDEAHVEEFARQALELLPPGRGPGRASVCLALGAHYVHQLRIEEAEPLLTESYETFREMGNSVGTIMPLTYLGTIAQGRSKHRARELLEQAIDAGKELGTTAAAHAYLAWGVYYEWNELDKALAHLERAIELSERTKGMGARPFVFNFLSLVLIARGDIEGARRAMDDSDRELAEMHTDPAHNAAHHIVLALAEEDQVSVSRWVDKLAQYENYLPPDIPAGARRLLLARKGKAVAVDHFQSEYEVLTRAGAYGTLIVLLVDSAIQAPSPEEAFPFIKEALVGGKSQGFTRTFVDAGMPLAPLLRLAISRGVEPEYARKLLDIIEAEERRRKIRRGELPATSTASLLSEREIEVLRLLAQGLSNRQIAERLVVSLNTAKTHVHNITAKLEAENRTHAIARARELKLI